MILSLLLFFIFIFISLYLSYYIPTGFVIFYVLVSTKFLGFLGIDDVFIFGGIASGQFTLNFITLLMALGKKLSVKYETKTFLFVIPFLLFMFWGIALPIIQNTGTIVTSVIASKEFWTISFFIYLYQNKGELKVEKILGFIYWIGIYLSLNYVVYLLFQITPPFYQEVKYEIREYTRGFFPTYISMTVFITYYWSYSKNMRLFYQLLTYLILFTGLLLAGHKSLLIGTLVSLFSLVLFYEFKHHILKVLFRLVLLTVIILAFVFYYQNEIRLIKEVIIIDSAISTSSRATYNQFRWDAITERPIAGYGFIHHNSSLVKRLSPDPQNPYMQQMGSIDSGYIDLLTKFGYIGMIIYLVIWAYTILLPVFNRTKFGLLEYSMSFYLIQFFLVNYTWSVFSYAHGLIPGFLAMYLILLNNKNENTLHSYII